VPGTLPPPQPSEHSRPDRANADFWEVDPLAAGASDRKERDVVGRRPLWGWIVLAALGVVFLRRAGSDAGWIVATIAFGWLFYVALVLPHELGHALFARLAGLELFEISIGYGPVVWSRRWRGVLFAVRGSGLGGFMRAAGRQNTHARMRHALLAIGGPAVNFALLLASLPIAAIVAAGDNASLVGAAANGFFWSNVWALAVTLIPHRYEDEAGGEVWNDGMIFYRAIRADAAAQRLWRERYYRFAADRARDESGAAQELEVAERGLAEFPDSFALRYAVASACLELGWEARARGVFRELLALPSLEPGVQVVLKNNIAYADLLLDDDLEEADRFSAEAAAQDPPVPHFLGTRGAALIRAARHAEAIPYLERAYTLHDLATNRASAAALLSIALQRLGRRKAAAEKVALAASLDPSCREVRLARAIVALERGPA
jgi:tetratricopeptide (TPR) repeat protein